MTFCFAISGAGNGFFESGWRFILQLEGFDDVVARRLLRNRPSDQFLRVLIGDCLQLFQLFMNFNDVGRGFPALGGASEHDVCDGPSCRAEDRRGRGAHLCCTGKNGDRSHGTARAAATKQVVRMKIRLLRGRGLDDERKTHQHDEA